MTTETKSTHTPGPWNHRDGSRFITATYNGIDTPLAEICVLPRKEKFPGYDGRETLTDLAEAEEQINADVFAAAPDLLEALELCQVALLQGTHSIDETANDALNLARAALAKARGGAA